MLLGLLRLLHYLLSSDCYIICPEVRIERAIQAKIADAERRRDTPQLRLARILWGNFQTLKAEGLRDVELEPDESDSDLPEQLALFADLARSLLGNKVVVGAQQEEFGGLVRTLRKAARLSQQGLAGKLGYDQTMISKIERGTRVPDDFFLRGICRVFGVDVGGYLTNSGPGKQKPRTASDL